MQSSSGYIFVLIWAYSQVAQAYTTFKPECTNPEESVNFVSSPPTRGTLDILWSSLFTIFACTWTILHLNVPEQREGRDPGMLGDLKWAMKAIWGKTKWMLAAVLAPEYLLYIGISKLSTARQQHPKLKALAKDDKVPWTLAHTTLANMGGFVVRGGSDRVGKDPRSEIHTGQTQSDVTKEWYILDLNTILKLRSEEHIVLPWISNFEIDDHSKGDNFAKGIAGVQIIWTIASAITRAHRGLVISQLEVSVIAFSVCALLIYACYWSTPKDVSVPITFLEWAGPIPPVITNIITSASTDHIKTSSKARIRQKPFLNDHIKGEDSSKLDTIAFLFGALFFGAPHILAWNFSFPTPVERIIWRTTSLYCSLIGIIMFPIPALPVVLDTLLGESDRRDSIGQGILFLAMVGIYVLARLFMIVEMFRTLLFLPPDAYIATWTASVPMFG
ncbi:hypothetical protein V498_07958 [Pseudogymnoascus sp. VKM F-4517 (FW-2822)]|nr:hypothetical protein V498_07958 [Pseudogymnoascus sp. VKM F-4517 (FW-2822)]